MLIHSGLKMDGDLLVWSSAQFLQCCSGLKMDGDLLVWSSAQFKQCCSGLKTDGDLLVWSTAQFLPSLSQRQKVNQYTEIMQMRHSKLFGGTAHLLRQPTLKSNTYSTSLTVDDQLDPFVCRSQDVCRLTLVHSRVVHLRLLNFQLTTKHH